MYKDEDDDNDDRYGDFDDDLDDEEKKMFRKSFETSLIISSEIIKFARKIVLCKSFSIGKKSNFNFQNRRYFEKKKSKSP